MGGSIFIHSGTLTLSDSTLSGNSATAGSGGTGNTNGQDGMGLGGAIFAIDAAAIAAQVNRQGMPGSPASVTGCGNTFGGNQAANQGGTDTDNADIYGASLTLLTASCPGGASIPVSEPIPTMSLWMQMLMTGLLAVLGCLGLRRRERRERE